jgi:hypothetical protein
MGTKARPLTFHLASLPGGVPSADTFNRVFLDEAAPRQG